jgi:uncharacterized protein YegL
MKENFVHVCAIIDESGSMYSSREDVVGGFQKMIDEQKEEKDGTCAISLFRFATTVKKDFIGKDVNEIEKIDYTPSGLTAMNDGIGIAITEIGKWLADMDEKDRPSKNIIVIMTDGAENNSQEYDFNSISNMIKHQEEKYNWTFIYMGTDITKTDDVKKLGIKMSRFSSRGDLTENYSMLGNSTKMFRKATCSLQAAATMDWMVNECNAQNLKYESEKGIKLDLNA